MSNLVHLAQLEGDALEVATEVVRRGGIITSSMRDITGQAIAMAKNCFTERHWILGDTERNIKPTYRWSPGIQQCHDFSVGNPQARYADLAAAFANILHNLPPDDLRKVSKHFAKWPGRAHAFDTDPVVELDGSTPTAKGQLLVDYMSEEARKRHGVFLTNEGGKTVWHWQAHD